MPASEAIIDISPLSPTPIYQQIRDQVVLGIARGTVPAGTRLAPVRTLAASFEINPATVTKAYELLRSEGFVATAPKSGTVVTRSPNEAETWTSRSQWRERLLAVVAEARAQGVPPAEILDDVAAALSTLLP